MPFIQGRSRMREIRSYGSVRGVAGDRYPYRDLACRPAGGRLWRLAIKRWTEARLA